MKSDQIDLVANMAAQVLDWSSGHFAVKPVIAQNVWKIKTQLIKIKSLCYFLRLFPMQLIIVDISCNE